MAKKLGRPFKHDIRNYPAIMTMLMDGEQRSERSVRNLCYRQNVFGTIKEMQQCDDGAVKEAARFWIDRADKTLQGLNVLFYELGKIDDTIRFGVLVRGHQLLRDGELTMKEFKECVVQIRRDASVQTDDQPDTNIELSADVE